MPNGNDRRVRQNFDQHSVDFGFEVFVKGRCRLIKKQPIRFLQHNPRDGQTLLLATGMRSALDTRRFRGKRYRRSAERR